MRIRQITVADAITLSGGTPCVSCCQRPATTTLDGEQVCASCKAAASGDED